MPEITLEICVDSPMGLAAAIEGGADRIELCAALGVGGLTPSPGMVRIAASCGVPVVAMIRPRAGDFVFGAAELAVMEADIAAMRAAGLAGVALGASRMDGRLDAGALARLAQAAAGMELVLHRCFDLVPDLAEAVETAVALGFRRILTSGGASTATAGAAEIADALALADGRIDIMPGAGITAANAASLLDRLAVRDIHASCGASHVTSPRVVAMGFASGAERQTEMGRVRALRQVVDRATATKRRGVPAR